MTAPRSPLRIRIHAGLTPEEARRWSPFAGTRELGSLLFGTRTLAERLAEAVRAGHGDEGMPDGGDALPFPCELTLDPRLVPAGPFPLRALVARLEEAPEPGEESQGANALALVTPDGDAVGTFSRNGPERPGPHPTFVVEGLRLHSPWDLMHRNEDRILRDLLDAPPTDAQPLDPLPPGVHGLGSYPVTVGPGVQLDPQVILDARKGPIHLAAGVEVQGFTRLEGPAWIGPGSRLQGGIFSGVSVGPVCRLRGEIEASVLNGWCNKAHDGYLGHAVLGRWVNLGALTTNSDLKNTYGPVRVPVSGAETEDTGLLKVGVLLGDHVKTGIGTLLNTGTVVGAGSTLFAGGGMPPRWVPPFSWGSGSELVPVRLEAFLEVAGRAMARRDQALTPDEEEALVALWSVTHGAAP